MLEYFISNTILQKSGPVEKQPATTPSNSKSPNKVVQSPVEAQKSPVQLQQSGEVQEDEDVPKDHAEAKGKKGSKSKRIEEDEDEEEQAAIAAEMEVAALAIESFCNNW